MTIEAMIRRLRAADIAIMHRWGVVMAVPASADGKANSQIWVCRVDGSTPPQRLTGDGSQKLRSRVSPRRQEHLLYFDAITTRNLSKDPKTCIGSQSSHICCCLRCFLRETARWRGRRRPRRFPECRCRPPSKSSGVAIMAPAANLAPSFFTFDGVNVVGTHLNGTLLGPTSLYRGLSTPAKPGETVVFYGNGFGKLARKSDHRDRCNSSKSKSAPKAEIAAVRRLPLSARHSAPQIQANPRPTGSGHRNSHD